MSNLFFFKRFLFQAICFSLIGLLAVACQKAPGTARDQLIYISEEKEIALGLSAFREILKNARLSRDPEVTLHGESNWTTYRQSCE